MDKKEKIEKVIIISNKGGRAEHIIGDGSGIVVIKVDENGENVSISMSMSPKQTSTAVYTLIDEITIGFKETMGKEINTPECLRMLADYYESSVEKVEA